MNEEAIGTYDAGRFDSKTLQDAIEIILTAEDSVSTQKRWETETPYLINLIENEVVLNEDSVVIDFGVGIGRLAKELIHKYNCHIFGVDISKNMRAMSIGYVDHPNYTPISPEVLMWLNLGADLCLSVWALQHVLLPFEALSVIHRNLRPGGKFFLVNEKSRFVPSKIKIVGGEDKEVWIDDGVDILTATHDTFMRNPEDHCLDATLDPAIVSGEVSNRSYYALFNK